jgi:hypothetical protein
MFARNPAVIMDNNPEPCHDHRSIEGGETSNSLSENFKSNLTLHNSAEPSFTQTQTHRTVHETGNVLIFRHLPKITTSVYSMIELPWTVPDQYLIDIGDETPYSVDTNKYKGYSKEEFEFRMQLLGKLLRQMNAQAKAGMMMDSDDEREDFTTTDVFQEAQLAAFRIDNQEHLYWYAKEAGYIK